MLYRGELGDTVVYKATGPDFERIDFCIAGASFNDTFGTLYSRIVTKGILRELGDKSLYDKYKSIYDIGITHQFDEVSFENGNFIRTVYTTYDDDSLRCVVYVNENVEEDYFVDGEDKISFEVLSKADVFAAPDNYLSYKASFLKEYKAPTIVTSFKDDPAFQHIYTYDYKVITDYDEALAFIEGLSDGSDVGLDTETTGLDVKKNGVDKLVGVVISDKKEFSRYLPFRHTKFNNLPIEFLGVIRDKMAKCKVFGANAKFDMSVFLHEGYFIKFDHDLILRYLILTGKKLGTETTLKHISFLARKLKWVEFEDLGKDINFADLDIETVKLYACPDADNTLVSSHWVEEQMPVSLLPTMQLEEELIVAKFFNEYYGIRLDMKSLQSAYDEELENLNAITEYMNEGLGQKYNYSSDAQMASLLFNRLGYPILRKSKEGVPSTDVHVLKKLKSISKPEDERMNSFTDIVNSKGEVLVKADDLNSRQYPWVLALMAYREYHKRITSYYKKYLETAREGRVPVKIDQLGAATGRQSSGMHTLPKALKKTVVADTPDHYLVIADYSQIELRLMMEFAGEEAVVEMSKDPEADLHRIIASIILGVQMHNISSEMRSNAKSTNFGVAYQMQGKGLAQSKYGLGATKKQEKEAQKSISEFFLKFPKLNNLFNSYKNKARTLGYTETLWGRRRDFHLLQDKYLPSALRSAMLREAANGPIQGTAGDIMKQAEINVMKYIMEKGWHLEDETGYPKLRPMISVHDELVLSVHKSIPCEEVLDMIQTCMEMKVGKTQTPLFTSAAVVDTWVDGKSDEYDIPYNLRSRMVEDYKRTGKTIGHKRDDVLKVINQYRDDLCHEFMTSIAKQSNYQVEEMVNLMTHPTKTHMVIALYHLGKEKTMHDAKIKACIKFLEGEGFSAQEFEEVKEESVLEKEAVIDFTEVNESDYRSIEAVLDEDTSDIDYEDELRKEHQEMTLFISPAGNCYVLDLGAVPEVYQEDIYNFVIRTWGEERAFYSLYITSDEFDKFIDTGVKISPQHMVDMNRKIKERLGELVGQLTTV